MKSSIEKFQVTLKINFPFIHKFEAVVNDKARFVFGKTFFQAVYVVPNIFISSFSIQVLIAILLRFN